MLFAQLPIATIIAKSNIEPPLFYILLHGWIQVFGTSEIATRSFSLLGVMAATIIVIEWAPKLFKESKFLQWFLPLFFFINPMILYYAFEVRAYGWYICFSTLSLFSYAQKRWRLFTLATIAAIYTHLYAGIIPLTLFIHYLITEKKVWKKPIWKTIIKDPFIRSLFIIGLSSLPMLIRILRIHEKLRDIWYYPVDIQLVKSVLANMFLGYEGTPWYLWKPTAYLSLILLPLLLLPLARKKERAITSMFVSMVFVPLILTIGISFIKPLFVSRYLIPVTMAEIFLMVFTLSMIKNRMLQYSLAAVLFLSVMGFNMWYPTKHPKVNIRQTMETIKSLKQPDDLVYADDPLVFLEVLYYATDQSLVKLYDPSGSPFPWYVGDAVIKPEHITTHIPEFPQKTYIIHTDASFSLMYTK